MEQMTTLCDLVGQAIQKKEEEKRIAEEQAAKDRYWKIPICYDDDEDNTIAITPVLPIEEPDNSLSMGDEHLDTIPATESDEVIKSSVENLIPIPSESEGIPDKMCDVPLCENTTPLKAFKEHSETIIDSNDDSTLSDDDSYENIDYVDASPPDDEIVSLEVVEIVIPEVGGIDTNILLTIKDDILREKLLNVNLLIANIEALKDNPAPSSDVMTKSSSTSLNLFLEETNTFDNSSPEAETFCFDLEEISSGKKSSGSTTTHSDISLSKYDSFIFDLSNDPFPPADRSDFYHEEFADELAHIISPPEYDCFYFKSEPDPGELTSIVDSGIPDNVHSTTNVNLPFEDDQSPLWAYVVWIFLSFLTYLVTPPYLLSCGNKDTIFDPGISIYHSFMPDVSHRSGTFMKFNDFQDCEDSRVRNIHSSFTSSASFWESTRNKLECLPQQDPTPHGEDLTTRNSLLNYFLQPGKLAKLRNDILMFQQHHGESLSEAWTRFKDLLQKFLIMALIVGFKFKFFKIMSPFILSARLTAPLVANSTIRILTNLEKSLRTSPSNPLRP
ncbi:hypothetical protein Tco_0077527 [Tanacetum coccineum]